MTSVRSPWEVAADLLFPAPDPYVNDPVGWVRDVLGEDLWSGQEWIANAVVNHRRIVIRSGHSTGKTRIISRLIAWWVSVHPIDDVRVVVTADNFDQITGVIWRELILLHQEKGLPGRVTLDAKWHAGINGNIEVAAGIKPSDKNPTGLQGRHARHLLVIIEECCGVPQEIWDAADSLASNEGATILAVGNPTDPSSYMFDVCKPGSGWVEKRIASIDTPEFTGEQVSDALRGVLASPSWVEGRKKAWGETSPQFISRILGEFPDISDDTLITPKWIKEAQERSLDRTYEPVLGVDIARYGEDETVIYRREGPWFRLAHAAHKQGTMETAGHVARILREIIDERSVRAWPRAQLDEDGVGGGVLDRLLEQEQPVMGLRGGMPAIDSDRFVNARSEWYWTLREDFERGQIDIDPADEKLAAQLGSIRWGVDSRGRTKVETKDDMRKRGLPSPDRADALVYSRAATAGTFDLDVKSHTSGESLTGDLLDMKW